MSDETKELKQEVQQLREDVRKILDTLESRASATFNEKVEAIREGLCEAGRKTRERCDQVKEVVEEHPFATAVGAVGTGLLIGYILGRRGSKPCSTA